MTKKTFEQYINEAFELNKRPSKLALQLKEYYYEQERAIKQDKSISDGERYHRIEKLKSHYGKEVLQVAESLHNDYRKLAQDATTAARKALAVEHKAPDDKLLIGEFERELADLKVKALVSTRADNNIAALNALLDKYSDPYFASQIKNAYSEIAGATLGIDGDIKTRQALGKVYEAINAQAFTQEQQEAQQALEYFANAESKKFFQDFSPATQSISSIVGEGVSKYLDSPTEGLASIEQDERAEAEKAALEAQSRPSILD